MRPAPTSQTLAQKQRVEGKHTNKGTDEERPPRTKESRGDHRVGEGERERAHGTWTRPQELGRMACQGLHGLTTLEPANADGAIMNPLASWQKSTTTAPASAKSFMVSPFSFSLSLPLCSPLVCPPLSATPLSLLVSLTAMEALCAGAPALFFFRGMFFFPRYVRRNYVVMEPETR